MNLVYAPRALRDLRAIASFLTKHDPSAATNILGAIKASIETLRFFPQVDRRLDEAGHRRIPVLRYPYLVFYRIAGDDLLILHIRHSARRPIDPATEL